MSRATAEHEVVIAGAGPNGLMLACELALAGIRPVVLDALSGPSAEPKANGLVGQVVRMLDLRGLYSTFTGEDGPPPPIPGWIFSGMQLKFLGLSDNPMNAMLMPQPRLVRLLEKRARDLGVDLRWGHRLTDLQAHDGSVTATVSADGGDYTVVSDYLVGADGGRSFVRKNMGIGFPGVTSPTVARIAHVQIPDEIRASGGGLDIPGFGRIPFGHNRFDRGMVIFAEFEPDRAMLGTMEYGSAADDVPMSIGELRASLRRILGVEVPLGEPDGPGPHALRRINGQNTRQADRYRAGRVLLLGDSAHVHSPIGGPGLNLGLQDAFNLGWKLAAEVAGSAPAGLLDSYESERRPVGERVMMHSLAQIALMAPGPEVHALRQLFGELLTIPDVSVHMARLLAGSDVRYEIGDDHRLSGFFAPNLTFADGRSVPELLRDARPVLLARPGVGVTTVAQPWRDRVDVVTATLVDPQVAALLIRPDGYVAWAADTFDAADGARLTAALHRWFGAGR